MEQPINIVIGSAGRRLYLLRWFREAIDMLGIDGQVIVTESDISSAAFTAGDRGVLMPRYSDPDYEESMLKMIDQLRPAMFVSVNDWELSMLGNGLGDKLRAMGVVVPGIADSEVASVTDKFYLEKLLRMGGISTPRTVLASDREGREELQEAYPRLVVKDRNGSGSSGLAVVESSFLDAAIARAAVELNNLSETSPLEQIVVQPFLPGQEFGVDVVGTFEEPAEREYKILARQKMRMRAGETDKAITVDSRDFLDLATRLGELLEPTGLIDIDVIRDDNGALYVIDVNPRFGGGYPFVHLAGANIPLYYVASLARRPIDESWATYKPGVISAKFEEVRVSGSD